MRRGVVVAVVTGFFALGVGGNAAMHAAAPDPTFLPLGFLTGDAASKAYAISADGSTIVGFSGTHSDRSGAGGAASKAVYWDVSSGYTVNLLGPGIARGVSADGSIIVGSTGTYQARSESFHLWDTAAKWSNGSLTALSGLGGSGWSNAYGVSADGSVIVGGASTLVNPFPDPSDNHPTYDPDSWDLNNWQRAVKWEGSTEATLLSVSGTPPIRSYPEHLFDLPATGVSADGDIIVGYKQGPAGTIGFRRTPSSDQTLWSSLGPRSWANAISDDGQVTAAGAWESGASGADSRGAAVRYVVTSRQLLGTLPGNPAGNNEGEGLGVDTYGRVVVGSALYQYNYVFNGNPGSTNVPAAFIWDERTGQMQDLNQIVSDAGFDLTGRFLSDATDVINNPDGTIKIVGSAIVQFHAVGFPLPVGRTEAFALTMVNPANYAGDANQDGSVDDADLAIVQANLGMQGAIWSDGDFTWDGRVGLRDAFGLFGNHPGAVAAMSVPEPASLTVMILAAATLLRRRR
ncbi:MAG: hypothetical protein JJU36_15555 [Phycisphaeraceae bacterium]|nr:hypothetical protein [Phycisphaeraceae bacterium]